MAKFDPEDVAFHFEAVKLSMKQDKNGYVLTLSIHPNDVPDELLRSWVGQRYTVAMATMGDDGEPIPTNAAAEAARAIQTAGILCRDHHFHRFLAEQMDEFIPDDEGCTKALRKYLGIESRTELRGNNEARQKFLDLRDLFKRSQE